MKRREVSLWSRLDVLRSLKARCENSSADDVEKVRSVLEQYIREEKCNAPAERETEGLQAETEA